MHCTLLESIKKVNKVYTVICNLATLGKKVLCELTNASLKVVLISKDIPRFIYSFSRPKMTTVPVEFDLVG